MSKIRELVRHWGIKPPVSLSTSPNLANMTASAHSPITTTAQPKQNTPASNTVKRQTPCSREDFPPTYQKPSFPGSEKPALKREPNARVIKKLYTV